MGIYLIQHGVENYRFCLTPKRGGNLLKTVILAISTVKPQKGHQPNNAQRINDLTKKIQMMGEG